MKKRNTSAGCGTCPYWHQITDYGECRSNAPAAYTFESGEVEFHLSTHKMHWCGQHPDFWAQAETPCPECAKRDAMLATLRLFSRRDAAKGDEK